MGVSSNSKPIKKKKKKVVETTKLDKGNFPLGVILGRNGSSTSPDEDRDSFSPPLPPPVSNDALHRLHSPEELAEIRKRLKAKQAEARETPKLFYQLDKLRAAAAPAKLLATESFVDDEQLKSVFLEAAAASSRSATADGEPFLFPFDVQELLLRGLLGGRYVPRWCNLLRFKYISQVALIVVDGVSEAEWNDHVDCFPHLQCMMPELPAKLLPPEVQGTTFLTELFSIPFSLSEMKGMDHFDMAFKMHNNNHQSLSSALKEEKAGKFLRLIDGLKKNSLERGEKKRGGETAATDVEIKDDDSEGELAPLDLAARIPANDNSWARDLMATDGVLTWVDEDHHFDVTSRKDLLLTEAEMARENFPLPYNLPPQFATEFVPSFESYQGVTASSPLFAVDCEMCLTERKTLELTHVAVVDEKLRCVFKTYVKPEATIVDYLTQFSGITAKHLSASRSVMTLKDVQRKLRELLPSDAILVGHSLNGDLSAMRLIHPYVIDTSIAFNLRGFHGQKSKLRDLAYILLGRKIQEFNKDRRGHDALEDAEATMQLALLKLRNGPGFADFMAAENDDKWPGGLEDFIGWYEPVAERQRKQITEARPVVRGKEDERNYASMEVDDADAAKNTDGKNKPLANGVEARSVDADSASTSPSPSNPLVCITLREAFLKRSVSARWKRFRNVFDQLRIQKARGGAVVDHEDQLEALLWKETSATKLSAPTDKLIVKEAIRVLPEHFFVCLQLHRYRKFVESETGRRKSTLRKLDNRLKKIHDALPTKSMIVVVFSGRKCPLGGEDSATGAEGRKEEPSFHHGLVFAGIKTS